MKRITVSLLIAAMLISSAACSNSTSDAESTASDTTAQALATSQEEKPNIPSADMGGDTITIATSGWYSFTPLDFKDIVSEDITGEPLNDVVYERQRAIESDYNCVIVQEDTPDNDKYVKKLTNLVASGDDAYDAAFVRGISYTNLIAAGLLTDLSELPVTDFTKPWWDAKSYEVLSIAGGHYGICTDITTADELSLWTVFFSKKIAENYQLDSPYDLVKSGKWVYDKMFDMCKAAASDLNGDGKYTVDDQYGMTHTVDSVMGILNSSGVYTAEKNSEDIPVFTIGDEGSLTKALHLFNMLYDEASVFDVHKNGVDEAVIFAGGRSLFSFTGVYMAQTYRELEDDFGIVPYPKYDENQSEYMPSSNTLCMSILSVPKSSSNLQNTGIILEEMAYRGYRDIRPVFYDVILQGKVSRDEESSEMLDYIFNNVTYDIGNVFNVNNYAFDFVSLTLKHKTDLSSFIASKQPAAQEKLDTLIETIKESN